MGEIWHADILITEDSAKTCIQQQFPQLGIITFKPFAEGWDNRAFLVNDEIIFRFPRRKIAVELIERENTLLVKLQNIITLNIPFPEYIGKPSDLYPYPFQGYRRLEGKSICQAPLTLQQREASLVPLAEFLKQLHAIDEATALVMGAKYSGFDRTQQENTISLLLKRAQKILHKGIAKLDMTIMQNEINIVKKIKLPKDKCLVHGDLYCRHLLFNKGKLSGVIDWGDIAINNRSVDLAVIFDFYPPHCYETFLKIYGPVDEETWIYSRFLSICGMLTVLLYSHDINDKVLFKEAYWSIENISPRLLQE